MTVRPFVASPAWSLQSEGNVLAGSIVIRDETRIEARILLNGSVLYESRHLSRDLAEGELVALRNRCAGEGWNDLTS